uniref:Uncharacterized protein n=1 Tax=Arundo donax TaxID=35708 RepID=A0A0A9CW33_ARUDO
MTSAPSQCITGSLTCIALCAADRTLLLWKLTSTFCHDTRLSPLKRSSSSLQFSASATSRH